MDLETNLNIVLRFDVTHFKDYLSFVFCAEGESFALAFKLTHLPLHQNLTTHSHSKSFSDHDVVMLFARGRCDKLLTSSKAGIS